MPKLDSILRRKIEELYLNFGPQGWWPRLKLRDSDSKEKIAYRFTVKHFPGSKKNWVLRGNGLEVWEVMVGAILTQNVAWTNVELALLNLAEAGVLTPEEVLACHMLKLGRLIKPARYYSQKAKKLKFAAQWFLDNRPMLRKLANDPASLRAEILSLWGIGPETADVILAYGFDIPIFVVDIYTRRLLYILSGDELWLSRPYDEVRSFCKRAILSIKPGLDRPGRSSFSALGETERLKEAHALIVHWGKVDGGRMAR